MRLTCNYLARALLLPFFIPIVIAESATRYLSDNAEMWRLRLTLKRYRIMEWLDFWLPTRRGE